MELKIRKLAPGDAKAYLALRRAMLLDSPLSFKSSPEDDFASNPELLGEILGDGREKVILGAFSPGLVGAVGIFRERHLKAAHRAHVWGMFVTPEFRRRGIGEKLLDAALAHAREMGGITRVDLGVSDAAPGAQKLYESAGFRAWGTEPHSIHYRGRVAAEHHMVLFLDEAEGRSER
jgi:ribosomal protein S18 acetylase RimI-like enzyme